MAVETKEAAPGSASDPGDHEQSAEESFLEILHNRDKYLDKNNQPTRSRGFVCVVRGPEQSRVSLHGLQLLCHPEGEAYNNCLTLRYRVESREGLGTFLHALVRDLRATPDPSANGPALLGSALPKEPETTTETPPKLTWGQFRDRLRSLGAESRLPLAEDPDGASLLFLDRDWVSALLALLSEEKLLTTGERLVLFCELAGLDDPEIWSRSLRFLLERLPYRVGLVLAGAPEGSEPPDDPIHYREITLAETAEREPDGELAQYFQVSGLSSDRPAREDGLAVTSYAEALAQFMLHPDTGPLTIGIHGPWGKGKSSFMGFLERHLLLEAAGRRESGTVESWQAADTAWHAARNELERTQYEGRQGRSLAPGTLERLSAELERLDKAREWYWARLTSEAERDVVCVPFNAWRFQDSKQIWAGLASVIIDRLEASLTYWQKRRLRFSYAWRARRSDVLRTLVELILAMLLAIILVHLLGPANEPPAGGENATTQAKPLVGLIAGTDAVSTLIRAFGGSFAVLLLAAWRINGIIRPMSERVLEYAQLPNYRGQMGFQHQVLNDIGGVVRAVRAHKRTQPRIMVFIDDLDRCSDDKIMEILQAINLVLGASNFYVVLGVDTEMLYRAVQAHYEEAHRLGRGSEAFARRYLRKIIQLSFHLPDTGEDERLGFIRNLFSISARSPATEEPPQGAKPPLAGAPSDDTMPSLPVDPGGPDNPDPVPLEQVTDSPHELQAFLDYAEFIEDNARETKHLVNVHRLVKIMLQHNQGWSRERQRRLIRWLIFCTRWPELIDDALSFAEEHQEDPDVLADGRLPHGAATRDAMLARFIADSRDPIPAETLSRDQSLALAARIAELVRESPELYGTGDGAPASPQSTAGQHSRPRRAPPRGI